MLKRISKPNGLFAGENFMTPLVLGYYKLRKGLGYAELSKGEGFKHEPIWGVTVNPDPDRKLSKMFHSAGLAFDYISDLSEYE